MIRRILLKAASWAILATACGGQATWSEVVHGPDGGRAYSVTCRAQISDCLSEAGRLCNRYGYQIDRDDRFKAGAVWLIHCKSPSVKNAPE